MSRVPAPRKLATCAHDVVALDDGDLQREPCSATSARSAAAQARGLMPPALLTTLIPSPRARGSTELHRDVDEVGRVAELGRLRRARGEDRHGRLGQVVEHQVVEPPERDQLRRADAAVAPEARCAADANDPVERHRHPPVVMAKRSNSSTRAGRRCAAKLARRFRTRSWALSILPPCPTASPRSTRWKTFMALPSRALIDDLGRVDGDLMILGVAGKMGPTLARLAKTRRADKRVIGVARFSDAGGARAARRLGHRDDRRDLLDRAAIEALPRVPNIVFAAGHKFGAKRQPGAHVGDEHARAGARRRDASASRASSRSRPATSIRCRAGRPGGASEATPPAPVGEYAQSCLGRERMFEYFSARHGTPGRIVRLNYAIDMRYGVLLDIAAQGAARRAGRRDDGPRQRDLAGRRERAGAALSAPLHDADDADQRHRAGDDLGALARRQLRARGSARRRRSPAQEAATALLSDTTHATALFGYPLVPLGRMLDWVADWVRAGGASLGKPTKFEVRDGASEALAIERLARADVEGGLRFGCGAAGTRPRRTGRSSSSRARPSAVRDSAGGLVATAAALPYGGGVGWISMVLVDVRHRHHGLATRLLGACVDACARRHRAPVLDATPAGAPVYRRGVRSGLRVSIAGKATRPAASASVDRRWRRGRPASGSRRDRSRSTVGPAASGAPRCCAASSRAPATRAWLPPTRAASSCPRRAARDPGRPARRAPTRTRALALARRARSAR